MDLNEVRLIGRVGRDPESKQVGGKTVVNFSVATSYGSGDNQHTEWHSVTAWEKLGEIAQKILHKGDRVFIGGRISYNIVGEGEAKKTFTHITASNLINLMARPAEAGNGSTNRATTGTNGSSAVEVPVGVSVGADEDLPF